MAGALSTAWVFIVPIFQAPDEPAHFDYAISMFDARGLIPERHGAVAWIASPYTRYLMRASDFERIKGHSSMRVPTGYGSRFFFARIDADAPTPNDESKDGIHPVSYIVGLYPFGFYAIEAAWMAIVASVDRSLVAMFFSARLLCVAFVMLGLYLNYRTALLLGMPAWRAVALIAAVGFFPLLTLVSAYVQPDNLAYLLISASVYLVLKLRGEPIRLAQLICLGLSLGLLAVTKYQFFIGVAIAALFAFTIEAVRRKAGALRVSGAIAILLLPSIALLAVQHWITAGAATHGTQIIGDFRYPSASGLAFWGYMTRSFLAAFTDYFITGPSAATYWGVLGWVDTPLVILSGKAELAIRVLVAFLTLSTFTAVGYSLGRNGIRLLRIGIRGRSLLALSLASRDAVFNSYVIFAAFMFVLYVGTGNVFGAEGRHWYPYMFPSFLCFVWYAPKVLRQSRLVGTIASCVLILYSAVASGYATVDVLDRYYGRQTEFYRRHSIELTAVRGVAALGTLWPVEPVAYHVDGRIVPIKFRAGTLLRVQGVTIAPNGQERRVQVSVILDRRAPLPTLSGQYDYRAAEITRSISRGYGGFDAVIETTKLAAGRHTIEAFVHASGGKYELIWPRRYFWLTYN